MKKIVFITAVFVLLSACSQKEKQPDITVENRVSFYIDKQAGKPPCDFIAFAITVKNRGEEPISNLRVANVREFAVFLVNNKNPGNPAAMGGWDIGHPEGPLSQNESDTYSWGEPVEQVQKKYGNSFTVQWKYMGISSRILEVDTVEKSVEQLEQDK